MKAVIIAAGEGVRMRPLTYTRSKVMLPIANKPILEHLLLEAKKAGFAEFIFVVGYFEKKIREYFGDGRSWGLKIEYVTQKKQLGTAHALKMTRDPLTESFLLLNGDAPISAEDIAKVLKCEKPCMALQAVNNPQDLGVAEVANGKVKYIHEKLDKPPSNLANAGVYLLDAAIFPVIDKLEPSPRGEYEITGALQAFIEQGNDIAYEEIASWQNLSYPWDLLKANRLLLDSLSEEILGKMEQVHVTGLLRLGNNSVVKSNTYIEGPVIIGENCSIGPNCYLRPGTVIGNNCHVGSFVEIKNSIIMDNTKVPHLNYIGDSIIGQGCNFGAGTKIANLRLDEKEIIVKNIPTGTRKLGAIIGDNVKTGINANINVASFIGNDTFIGPGALVSGEVQPYSRIY